MSNLREETVEALTEAQVKALETQVKQEVEKEQRDDLRKKYPARDQYVTISCISGNVGTNLIGTTQWTGVSLQKVLADAKMRPNARYLYITSGDGFGSLSQELFLCICRSWYISFFQIAGYQPSY